MWDLLQYSGNDPDLLGWDTSGWDSQTAFTAAVYNPRPASGGGPSAAQSLSALADRTEAQLRANLAAYQAGQLPAADASANAWALLNSMVSQMLAAGSIGEKSAAERDRRLNPAMLRWDWIGYYIDPIPGAGTAAGASQAPMPGGGVMTAGFGGFGGFGAAPNNQWLVLAAVAVLVILLVKK
jgi:hypothetical protein